MPSELTFGAFFRARRKALGLSQSEFCRRNGLDKGNVSRLERGLVRPPQDHQLLKSYAKALKLESSTGEWECFFDLAATETGRVPADLLQDERTTQELPRLLRAARASRQRHAARIRAVDLEGWANTLDARATLPQLVRKLVRATGRALELVEFPAHEGVQRTGWDGIVEARETAEFVPEGSSRWEMGVDQDPRKKAEEDFGKRTKSSGGLDKKRTVFVFVTPRKWQNKEEWRRAKEALGAWREVRVYDSASLEEWLEQAPAADAWFGRILGIPSSGLTTLDVYWENLQAMTRPSLEPEAFLASREKEAEELRRWLEAPPRAMVIDAGSPTEAIDFVVACIASQVEMRRDSDFARTLIVEDRDTWRSLTAESGTGLLLIAHPSLAVEPEMVAEAQLRGHRVLLPSGLAPREGALLLKLPRVYRYDLEPALVSSGVDAEEARRFAREAGGSLTVLKRLLGRLPGTTQPEWSRPPEASSLVPMLLAGSWDDSSEADRSAMARLSGGLYADVARIAERWLKAPDAPLMRVGSRWSLVSRNDSWHLLASAVSRDDLDRFKQVALDVLAEDDPAYEAAPGRRWLAKLHREGPCYTRSLRTGLAETLAILGTRPGRLDDISEFKAWNWEIDRIVQELLSDRSRIRWASLAEHLPLLAEAAPDAFLAAIERDLDRPDPAVPRLFEQESNGLLALNPHIWLLSALEVLAWSRDHVSRVSLILASLDEMASRDTSGDSAFRSLLYIFMPWLPQTTAPVEERIKILKTLVRRRPNTAWRLFIGLLPNQQSLSTSIPRPLWRDWALGWSGRVATLAYGRQLFESTRLLIQHAGTDIGRWAQIIKHLEDLPEPNQRESLKRLRELAVETRDEESRRVIADALRERVSWHRHFSQAKWALPEQTLSELEEAQRRFEPDDPVRRSAWLFEATWQLPAILDGGDEGLQQLRRSAVREVLDRCGWPGVTALVEAAKAPEAVGAGFAEAEPGEGDASVLPTLIASSDDKTARFAHGYIRKRFFDEGWAWVDQLTMDDWSAEQVARFFLADLPFERRTWAIVEKKGEEASAKYWRNVWPRLQVRGNDDELRSDLRHAIERLLQHESPAAATFALLAALPNKVALDSDLLMDVLEAGARTPVRMQNVAYGIPSLIQELQRRCEQHDPGVDPLRVARLESYYLGLMDGNAVSPAVLHKRLRDDAETFVEILGLIFRPKDEPAETAREYSDEEKRRAEGAYRLLLSWKDVPGSPDGRTVDERALLEWIRKARSLAQQRGLLDICDSRIGEVLAYAFEEPDGAPSIPVRDVLEEIGADSNAPIFQGLSAGIYNKRGLHTKSLREGGDQERDLARKYQAFAEASQSEWPKMAAALRRIARSYEEDARREDERAMLD